MKYILFNNGREKWIRFTSLKVELNLECKKLSWSEFDKMYLGRIPYPKEMYDVIQSINIEEEVKLVKEVAVEEVKPKKGKKKVK